MPTVSFEASTLGSRRTLRTRRWRFGVFLKGAGFGHCQVPLYRAAPVEVAFCVDWDPGQRAILPSPVQCFKIDPKNLANLLCGQQRIVIIKRCRRMLNRHEPIIAKMNYLILVLRATGSTGRATLNNAKQCLLMCNNEHGFLTFYAVPRRQKPPKNRKMRSSRFFEENFTATPGVIER
jgi:hypothetical protein